MSTFYPLNDGIERYQIIVSLEVIQADGKEYYPIGEEVILETLDYGVAIDTIKRLTATRSDVVLRSGTIYKKA